MKHIIEWTYGSPPEKEVLEFHDEHDYNAAVSDILTNADFVKSFGQDTRDACIVTKIETGTREDFAYVIDPYLSGVAPQCAKVRHGFVWRAFMSRLLNSGVTGWHRYVGYVVLNVDQVTEQNNTDEYIAMAQSDEFTLRSQGGAEIFADPPNIGLSFSEVAATLFDGAKVRDYEEDDNGTFFVVFDSELLVPMFAMPLNGDLRPSSMAGNQAFSISIPDSILKI